MYKYTELSIKTFNKILFNFYSQQRAEIINDRLNFMDHLPKMFANKFQ